MSQLSKRPNAPTVPGSRFNWSCSLNGCNAKGEAETFIAARTSSDHHYINNHYQKGHK